MRNIKQFLRRKDLAARYGVDLRTVERMLKDGRIPPCDYKNKRAPLWSPDSLERHERQTMRTPRGGRS
jgi:hypothetical protein